MKVDTPVDYVAWVRNANARWIVHHDLGQSANAYLDYLAKHDQPRLVASCQNCYAMVWKRDEMEDPKPWFYGGLFSLATQEELNAFLANHWLTRMVITRTEQATSSGEKSVEEVTLEKIQRLRAALRGLPTASSAR